MSDRGTRFTLHTEPIVDARSRWAELWRAAARELRASPLRARFPAALHVGTPGDHEVTLEGQRPRDFGERVELVTCLIDSLPATTWPLLVWFTRPGELTSHDEDQLWHAATRQAAAELAIALPFAVVTRQGWYDPVTSERGGWRS